MLYIPILLLPIPVAPVAPIDPVAPVSPVGPVLPVAQNALSAVTTISQVARKVSLWGLSQRIGGECPMYTKKGRSMLEGCGTTLRGHSN